MKTRLIPILVVSAILAAVCLAAGQQQKGKPAVQGNRCIQFPGTPLPEPNLSNIVKRLRQDKYPDNFRVRVWSNGKPTQTIGSMRISESEMSQTDKYAKSIELTGLTGRIGECVKGKAAISALMVDDLKDLIDDIRKDLK
jgi:hypothetical protein